MNRATLRKRAQRKISVEGRACATCGSTENLERHHPDYRRPLHIVVLCKPCHGRLSARKRWG